MAVVPKPDLTVRGRLAERIDDIIERELAARGAPSPFLTAWSSMPDGAEPRLADQLFRARSVGATGIAISMASLAAIASPALTPDDSATLRALTQASATVPLVVMLDDGDMKLCAYAPPKPLEHLLGISPAIRAENRPRSAQIVEEATIPEEALEVETRVDVAISHALPGDIVDVTVAHVMPTETAEFAPEDPSHEELARMRATVGVPVSGPSDAWRSWAVALTAARGPQPLPAFERLFTENYTPLVHAIACGVSDPRAIRARDEFREAFQDSYTDAFAAFGATVRRPRLVMDAFDIASKLARLHNARTSNVLVVDSMRYDLGIKIRDRLAARAAGTISLTHESLLWSALPTTTYRQLETLARGMDALRAPAGEDTPESLRGGRAESVRRLRIGSREMYKLDIIPSMLSSLGEPDASPARVVHAFDSIAASVTECLEKHIQRLAPRTLLFILGDHGFTIDRKGRVTHGEASPEEVLVPCFAYLIADLH